MYTLAGAAGCRNVHKNDLTKYDLQRSVEEESWRLFTFGKAFQLRLHGLYMKLYSHRNAANSRNKVKHQKCKKMTMITIIVMTMMLRKKETNTNTS